MRAGRDAVLPPESPGATPARGPPRHPWASPGGPRSGMEVGEEGALAAEDRLRKTFTALSGTPWRSVSAARIVHGGGPGRRSTVCRDCTVRWSGQPCVAAVGLDPYTGARPCPRRSSRPWSGREGRGRWRRPDRRRPWLSGCGGICRTSWSRRRDIRGPPQAFVPMDGLPGTGMARRDKSLADGLDLPATGSPIS